MKSFLILFLFFHSCFANGQEANIKQILDNSKKSGQFSELVLPYLKNLRPKSAENIYSEKIQENMYMRDWVSCKVFTPNEIGNYLFSDDGLENVFFLKTTSSSGYELIHLCSIKWSAEKKIWFLKSQIIDKKIIIKKESWLLFKG